MKDQAEQLLRHHGVQVTAQRLAVIRAVAARPHATADEVADDVRGVIGSISRQAVYDALAVLADKHRATIEAKRAAGEKPKLLAHLAGAGARPQGQQLKLF